ncbi:MAG: prolyl oligopeptidase family serine peptidase [Caldilineaceae bacterium]
MSQCNRDLRLYVESFLGHPATQRDVYWDGSTIFQVEQVQKPVLILHGLLDTVVAPERRNSGWKRCANTTRSSSTRRMRANHGFLMRKTKLDATRIERFLDWYLLPR